MSTRSTSCSLGLEVEAQAVGQVLFVLDDEDAAHAAASERELHGERAAAAGPVALGEDLAAVARDDGADDEEAEAGALDARRHRARDAVEALEDLLQLGDRNADAAIADAERGGARVGLLQLHGDLHLVARST